MVAAGVAVVEPGVEAAVVRSSFSPTDEREGAVRPKHVPLRTCVICRERQPKRSLTRIVRTPDGEIRLDASGKLNGRGAYVCVECRGLGDSHFRAELGHALKSAVTDEDMARLAEEASGIVRQTTE